MSADAGRWNRVKDLFQQALDRRPDERQQFLLDACGPELDLRHEVESLLTAHAHAGSFAVRGPAGQLASAWPADPTWGPYRVISRIGAGGMGEVYRARDTKLGREVALKVLPRALHGEPDRIARLEREARLLAQLNHPHIATIHGLEERSGEDGQRELALVMELVEGPTLAERVSGGPLRLEDAVRVAIQMADALGAAHDKGILHRDLKPANVKFTATQAVKVLDFGLAKAFGIAAVQIDTTEVGQGTAEGLLVGTPAYMSPEQARGGAVDRRADVWSLGCVLYEMVTGRAAFGGATIGDVLAGVIEREPDWTALPGNTPASIRKVLRRCLDKEANRRFHDVHDLRIELEDGLGSGLTDAVLQSPGRRAVVRAGALGLGALAVSGVSALVATGFRQPNRIVASTLSTVAADVSAQGAFRGLAIAPGGSRVVYEAGGVLHLRALDERVARRVDGTEGGQWPTFSPDGDSIAFFAAAESAIKSVPVAGGPATLVTRTNGGTPRGLAWGPDGSLVFATSTSGGLHRVAAVGGRADRLTTASRRDIGHEFPTFVPNGRTVIFTAFRGGETAVCAVSMSSGESTDLVMNGTMAKCAGTGHLLYVPFGSSLAQSNTVLAVPFDAERAVITAGTPVPVQEGVHIVPVALYDVARNGSFVYVAGETGLTPSRLTWVDRTGHETPLDFPVRPYRAASISPDGQQIALRIDAPDRSEVWVSSLDRPTFVQLPLDPGHGHWGPFWTQDSRDVVFTAYPLDGSPPGLFRTRADGTGNVIPLVTIDANPFIWFGDWTNEGALLFTFGNRPDRQQSRIGLLDAQTEKGTHWRPFLERASGAGSPSLSPDGHWIAYQSSSAVFVEPLAGREARHLISADPGGTNPFWSPDGREIFYRRVGDQAIMSVRVSMSPAFTAARPEVLFEDAGYMLDGGGWNIDPAGRFLMIKTDAPPPRPLDLILVQNWSEQLRRLVPA